MSVFIIVGRNEPLYEADLGLQIGSSTSSTSGPAINRGSSYPGGAGEESHVNQFIVHSALDMVERKQWSTPAT